jgi:hypothetical protein
MDNSSPNNPKPFGHHTVSLRAHFAPDDAAPSIPDITRFAGPNQVPAVLVPEGASPPGHPYEHIAQAMFTPDQDDTSNSTDTSPPQSRSAAALAGTRRGTPMPGNNTQRGPRQFAAVSANAPWSGAPGANHADSNSAATASMPRRPVRSAQANFSAAAPQPHLDNSQDAVNAAVLPLVPRPGLRFSRKPPTGLLQPVGQGRGMTSNCSTT